MLPGYIQRDIDVDSIRYEYELIEKNMYRDASVSGVAFGETKTGYAESGSSLRLRMGPDLSKAARIVTAFYDAVVDTIHVASLLQPNMPELTGIVVTFKDGLPEDEKEKVEPEVRRETLASPRSSPPSCAWRTSPVKMRRRK